jgi:hypothetical protein
MRSIGFLLLVLGGGSFILHSMDYEFKLLKWVDNWGADTGTAIRIGMAAVGLILVVLSFRKKQAEATADSNEAS